MSPDDILFYLPVTKNWLYQLILGLVLICHSSYRGVVELFRDLFDTPISIGTVHNWLEAATETTTEISQSQALSGIEVGLLDEIFQADKPVLVGVDAASTYCYLLKRVERRDEETWGYHLLDVMAQGFDPDYTIVENLNSRLRNYFFLRHSLGDDYLSLLKFFLNHRQFLRSRVPERVGKSPKEVLTEEAHPH